MTTYNTGNPLGSSDPKDLYDNAQNFDTAINSTDPTWTDRLGVERQTLPHALAEFPNAQANADSAAADATRAENAADDAELDANRAEAARDAALFSRGVWPTTAAGMGNGVAGVVITSGGSGGTNGTFALAFSGGTQVLAPAGVFTVVGGVVVSVTITYGGYYSAGTPTLSFAASAGLTGTNITAVMAANTNVNEYFSVPLAGSDESLILYRVDTGPVANEVTTYPSADAISLRIGDVSLKTSLLAASRGILIGNAGPSENGLLYKVAFVAEAAGTVRINRMRVSGGNLIRDSFVAVVVPGAGYFEYIFPDAIEIGTDFRLGLDVPANFIRQNTGTRDAIFNTSFYLDTDGVIVNTPSSFANFAAAYFVVAKTQYKYYKALKDDADLLSADVSDLRDFSQSFTSSLATVADSKSGVRALSSYPFVESTLQGRAYSMVVENSQPLMIPALDVHVDTVGGNDANPGTRNSPKLSFPTFVTNGSYGFSGGQTIKQTLALTVGNSAICGYRGLPVFDGADEVTETWVQHDAIGFPNTWSVTVSQNWGINQARMMIWEDDLLMKRVSSIEAVDAEAGTYFSPSDNAFIGVPNNVLYMHPSDSMDPNTNGRFYERTVRLYVVNSLYAGGTVNQIASRIVAARQGVNDGSIVLGKNSVIDRCLCYDGHKHNALQESGLSQNSAYINGQPEVNYLHVFYTGDATGLFAEYKNNVFVGQENGGRGTAAIYCHDNSALAHESMVLTNNLFANVSAAVSSASVTLSAQGTYVENANSSFNAIYSNTVDFSHWLINQQFSTSGFEATGSRNLSQFAGYLKHPTNDSTSFIRGFFDFGDIALSQSTLVINTVRRVFRRDSGIGTFSMNRCIVLIDSNSVANTILIQSALANLGTINNNVYYIFGGGASKANLMFNVDGTTRTVAQWQSLGFDANSVFLDETDIAVDDLLLGDPERGDFRLKPNLVLQLPDLTPVLDVGVTEHWDFNAKRAMPEAPSRWPDMPKTRADGFEYVADPDSWAF